MMGSVKESLRTTIESLSDEQARQVLEYAERLRKPSGTSLTLTRLAGGPAFKISLERPGPFPVIEPIQGRGADASKLLVEDRR
jgi:hypothetical protein